MNLELCCLRCRSRLQPVLYEDDEEVVWICRCLVLGSRNGSDQVTARYWSKNRPSNMWLLEEIA